MTRGETRAGVAVLAVLLLVGLFWLWQRDPDWLHGAKPTTTGFEFSNPEQLISALNVRGFECIDAQYHADGSAGCYHDGHRVGVMVYDEGEVGVVRERFEPHTDSKYPVVIGANWLVDPADLADQQDNVGDYRDEAVEVQQAIGGELWQ